MNPDRRATAQERHGGPVCHWCGDPILPDDHWAGLCWPDTTGQLHAAHVVCQWTVETIIR